MQLNLARLACSCRPGLVWARRTHVHEGPARTGADGGISRDRPILQSCGRGLSGLSGRCAAAPAPAAGGRPRVCPWANPQGLFLDALLQSRQRGIGPRSAGDRAPAVGGHHTPRAGAHCSAGPLDRWRHRRHAGNLGTDPRRASARCAGLSPAPLPRLLVRPPASHGGCTPTPPSSAGAPSLPGWPALLACRCFAHEEMGNYAVAEAAGREAIALAPGDLWAAHGVAHVLEMQGRRDEGIAWLAGLEPHWEGGNNLKHHLWWHRGLYHFERREFAEVLSLYDRNFRDLASPLTQAQPDIYIDVQNAASMLFRLERQGVDVGNRWNELADKAEGAHRRLPVHLYAPALDDGPDGRRPLGRRGAYDRRHARICGGRRWHGRAAGARLRASDRRGAARPRQGRSRARLRPDAARAGGHEPPRRQPRAAGRPGAAVSGLRRARPPHRRHRCAGRACFKPAPCIPRPARRLCRCRCDE